ncbi:MAG TPA: CoA transferase [Pseudonocardia sp.]
MISQVLEGVRVVEFSQLIAAPYCGLTLLDLGADVIKVESPHGDYTRTWTREGQESGFFHTFNRGKRGVVLDYRTEQGRADARRLVASADVVVENLGNPDRTLGFGPDEAMADDPRLVWCTITGFGRGRGGRAIDQTFQASMGMIALTGERDGPPLRVPMPIVDLVTAMYASQSVLAALLDREHTGRGALLDCALIDAAATCTSTPGALAMTGYNLPRRTGSESDVFVPSAIFEAADHRHVQIVAIGDGHWRSLCRGLGIPEWAQDQRFADATSRLAHREIIHGRITEIVRTDTSANWAQAIGAAGGFCEPIREIEEAWADPALADRGLIAQLVGDAVGSMSVPLAALVPDRNSGPFRCGPTLGQHNDEVFGPLSAPHV